MVKTGDLMKRLFYRLAMPPARGRRRHSVGSKVCYLVITLQKLKSWLEFRIQSAYSAISRASTTHAERPEHRSDRPNARRIFL
jgi:hypothetical protein